MPIGDTGAPLYLPLYADNEHNWGQSMDASLQTINDAIGAVQGAENISGAANLVLATPDGAAGVAALRALVPTDIPDLTFDKITGTIDLSQLPIIPQSQITNLESDLASLDTRVTSLETNPVGIFPITTGPIAGNWLDSYDAATGEFGQSQPTFNDLGGALDVAQVPNLPESHITNLVVDLAALDARLDTLESAPPLRWDTLGNAAANLTLANAGFTTTFNQTSAVAWKWANTTLATNVLAQSSPILTLAGQAWNGSVSGEDNWTIQTVIENGGPNPGSKLTFNHTGSSGAAALVVPRVASANNGSAQFVSAGYFTGTFCGVGFGNNAQIDFIYQPGANVNYRWTSPQAVMATSIILGWGTPSTTTLDTAFSRLGAASLALGNGTAGDFTGALTLAALTQQNATAATSSVAQSSPIHTFSGQYWNGSASAEDKWTLQNVPANGTNAGTVLTLGHTGTTGAQQFQMQNSVYITWSGLATANQPAGSIPYIGLESNGTQGNLGINGGNNSYGIMFKQGGLFIMGLTTDASATNKRLALRGDAAITWSVGAAAPNSTIDLSISRVSTNTLGIGATQGPGGFGGNLQLTNLSQVNATAATASVSQSSPIHTYSGQYWNGSASAADTWTIQSVLANGTNGTSALSFVHTGGTTGAAYLEVPAGGSAGVFGIKFAGLSQGLAATASNLIFDCGNSNGGIQIKNGANALSVINHQNSPQSNSPALTAQTAGAAAGLCGNVTSQAGASITYVGNVASVHPNATSGTQVGFRVGLGSSSGVNGNLRFIPTTGSGNFYGTYVNFEVNQTGSATGNYSGLVVNVVETALLGTANLLLDLQSGATGGTSQFAITNTGKIKVPTTNTAASATAGSSGSLPAQVAGYLIVNIGGTDRKVPYYAI